MVRKAAALCMGFLVFSAFSALAAAPADPAATKAAIEAVKASAGALTTLEADQTISMDVMGAAMTLQGHLAVLKPDLIKFNMEPVLPAGQSGQNDMMAAMMKMTVYMDKTTVWIHMPEANMVQKFDKSVYQDGSGQGMNLQAGSDPSKVLDDLDPETVQLLGEETFDGAGCYVFQGKLPKPASMAGAEALPDSMKIWIGKGDGLARKTEAYLTDGKLAMSATLSNIKTGVPLSPAAFAFTPPAGVQVMDMTEMLRGQMQGQQSAPVQK